MRVVPKVSVVGGAERERTAKLFAPRFDCQSLREQMQASLHFATAALAFQVFVPSYTDVTAL